MLVAFSILVAPEASKALDVARVVLHFFVKEALNTEGETDTLVTEISDVSRVKDTLLEEGRYEWVRSTH